MQKTDKPKTEVPAATVNEEQWPGIDSRYRLIVLAALRTKQLLHGSVPRIEADPRRRRNTSIALEEVKRGLVPFKTIDEDHKREDEGNGYSPKPSGR
ncbi:MAG TPA: DNA-directed RNA polymerase subunit omega [Pyrinomonadaceae bacterium]|jgi:DNA-directed RNA polymerase omega subunit